MDNVEAKLDQILEMLEQQEVSAGRAKSPFREIFLNTVFASVVGYFIFRILDTYLKR